MRAVLPVGTAPARAACSSRAAACCYPSPSRASFGGVLPPALPVPSTTGTAQGGQQPTLHVPCAQRRVIEPVDDFGDMFMAMSEKAQATGFLPKTDTLVLIESIRSQEQALRVLSLIAQMLQVRVGMAASVDSDWHVRKRWYTRFCERALFKLKKPDLAYEMVKNPKVFAISKYFAADLVADLGKRDETDDVWLTRIVELNRAAREPGCKGVKRAYMELIEVSKRRKDDELLSSANAGLKALLAAPAPAASAVDVEAPAPAPAAVVAA